MADDRLNIKKVINDNAHVSDLSSLANSGVRKVKVLDEDTLQDLIRQAIDEVIHTQTTEERSKILADSRKQLQKLMGERDQFISRNDMLEANKNQLVQEIERLQTELKARREIEEQETELQKKSKEILAENAWLREEHDRMVEQLDQAEQEIKRLKAEIERLNAELEALRAQLADQDALRAEVEQLRAEAADLRENLKTVQAELSAHRESEEGAVAMEAQAEEELVRAREEIARLEGLLKAAGEEARKAQQAEAAARMDRVRQEKERLAREQKDREDAEERERQERERQEQERREQERLERERQEKEDQERREREEQEREEQERQERERREAAEAEERARAEEEAAKAKAALEEVPVIEEKPKPPTRIPLVLLERVRGSIQKGKGLDIGTVNLVAAEQNDQGDVELRLKRNVFIDVEVTPYTKSMLTRLNVPYVIQNKRMYVMGEEAFELANVLNRNTRRPMADGLISPKEQDALPIMKLLIGSILGEPRAPMEVCFYSVPGDPVDSDLSVAYHRDLFDAVLKALGYKPSHVIEGHAVTFAELADEDFTGIGISCGGGMFNICVAYKSMPALTFSTARSGDWVDMNVAQALGIKPAKAALIKERGVDLLNPKNREEDAISIYYRNLIQYNLTNIAERFTSAENMPTFSEPITIVFSGGTSMAGNFIELVKDVFKKIEFPIPVKEIRLAKDPLNATAKGALVAAQLEMASQAT